MNENKIAAAAAFCLNRSLETKRPFSNVKSHLDQLKADADWSEAEIVEVQTRVIRALMQQLGTSDPTDPPKHE
jgi:hypothetical protein